MQARNTNLQPIIIIGAARSGTKYLRDILGTTADSCKVPYDINYIWRAYNETWPDDAIPAKMADDRVKRFVREQIMRLAAPHPVQGGALFEKTVGNCLRVPFVGEVFPEALYIHLIRDGRPVVESAARQWKEPPRWSRLLEKLRGVPLRNADYVLWFAKNYISGLFSGRDGGRIWGPRYPGIDADVAEQRDLIQICARQWAHSVRAARISLAAIDDKRVFELRYEDLVNDPATLTRLCKFCGFEDSDQIVTLHQSRVSKDTNDKWHTALDKGQQQLMSDEIGDLLTELGYLPEENKKS